MVGPDARGAVGGTEGAGTGRVAGGEAGTDCGGVVEHDTRLPTIAAAATSLEKRFMTLILLEALGALALLVLIVWWTMFSGRDKGELPDRTPDQADDDQRRP